MKAVKVIDGKPALVEAKKPSGNGVLVKVVSASICGSDLHMMKTGAFGDRIIGHEFAGYTKDGRAVAVETITGCGLCGFCEEGHRSHCANGLTLMGVHADGGIAEYVTVQPENLVELPTGLDVNVACLIEPLAVALHGIERVRIDPNDRVLIIGAGAIGLSVASILHSKKIRYDLIARYDHQKQAAKRLSAGLDPTGFYDVVIDAVGNAQSLQDSVNYAKPLGRIGMLGFFWEPVPILPTICVKEVELIPSIGYRCDREHRIFTEAASVLHHYPYIADILVTHRFPIEGVTDAFETAENRSHGALKVVFDL